MSICTGKCVGVCECASACPSVSALRGGWSGLSWWSCCCCHSPAQHFWLHRIAARAILWDLQNPLQEEATGVHASVPSSFASGPSLPAQATHHAAAGIQVPGTAIFANIRVQYATAAPDTTGTMNQTESD